MLGFSEAEHSSVITVLACIRGPGALKHSSQIKEDTSGTPVHARDTNF